MSSKVQPDLRLPARLAAQLRRRLRRDGARPLSQLTGVGVNVLHAAAAEMPIRRASRMAIELMLAVDHVADLDERRSEVAAVHTPMETDHVSG